MIELHPHPVRGVVFDLDGTLTVPVIDFRAMRRDLGILEGDILDGIRAMTPDERQRAVEIIIRHEEDAARRSEMSPGARELVDFLVGRRIPIGVATRNSRISVDAFSKKHGVLFHTIVTRDDAPPKPAPEPLWKAVDGLGVPRENAVYVGDHEIDRLTGEAAGVGTYIVRNHVELQDHGPEERRIDSLADLIGVIERSPAE
jgi:HAD superfamily hydrolase (TIGR01549 family)